MEKQLEGYSEYIDILNTLGDERLVQSILRAANRAALKPMLKDMRNIPNFPKHLLKDIRIASVRVDGMRHPNANAVGPSAKKGSRAHILRFLNTGTVERFTKGGVSRGMIQGKKSFQPFVEARAERVQKEVNKEYGVRISEVLDKRIKRINKNK